MYLVFLTIVMVFRSLDDDQHHSITYNNSNNSTKKTCGHHRHSFQDTILLDTMRSGCRGHGFHHHFSSLPSSYAKNWFPTCPHPPAPISSPAIIINQHFHYNGEKLLAEPGEKESFPNNCIESQANERRSSGRS